MTGALHASVRGLWAGGGGAAGAVARGVLTPVEWLYRAAVARRNRRFDRRGGTRVEGVAVVSVGNLTVGGTGKTPLAAWVARRLADEGVRVALVARGYGDDELLLHRRWNPDVPVVADPDRVGAARRARDGGAAAVVLDDGFQHRRLARDVDVVLLAAEDPFPGRLLPRGPYREPAGSLARAHAVVVTRRTAAADTADALARRVAELAPGAAVAVASLAPGGWQDLGGRPAPAPRGPTLAVAAVARPDAFRAQVEGETGADVELLAFPDHHVYAAAEARDLRARAGARTVVVTEKDAVKLERFEAILDPVRVLTLYLRWETGGTALQTLITSVARPGA